MTIFPWKDLIYIAKRYDCKTEAWEKRQIEFINICLNELLIDIVKISNNIYLQ